MKHRLRETSGFTTLFRTVIFGALALAAAPSVRAAIPAQERQVLLDFYASTDGDNWLLRDGWNGAPGTECQWFGITCDAGETHVKWILFTVASGVSNNLSGTLPASLSTLTHLEALYLSSNHITGPMPSLRAMSQLRSVDISYNALTGPFPDLRGLSQLRYFYASMNSFDGPIPPLTGLDSLTVFYANGNGMKGEIPDLSGAPNLEVFGATYNQLSGPIPSLAPLHSLRQFNVISNWLTGSLPPLGEQTTSVGVSFNLISGSIPPAYMALSTFDGSNNRLSGEIPALQATTGVIMLDNNLLEGSLPPLDVPAQPFLLWVRNNELTGPVPPLAGTHVFSLSIGDNALSGALPPPPPQLSGPDVTVCPNNFDLVPNADWDAILGDTPWYAGCAQGSHQNLNQPGIGGTWYDPATSGQGLVLASFPFYDMPGELPSRSTLFGGWFTYATDASDSPAGQTWYSIQGDVDDTTTEATLGLYESMNGLFISPPIVSAVEVGTATLTFTDCTHATMRYHFNDGRVDDGAFPLIRLVPSTTCTRAGISAWPVASAIDSGAFYEPSQAGQGFVVDVDATTNTLFGAWYTYGTQASADNRRWFSLQANIAVGATAMSDVPIYASTGGAFGAATPVTTRVVGTADLAFEYCAALTIIYRFTDGENAGLSGTRTLQRVGPGILCP